MLKISNLTKHFGGLKAINDVSFNVEKGEILGILGPNGAGKTTLFNLVSGFIKPTSGQINFKTHTISGMKNYEIARLGITRTFQATRLFFEESVMDNLIIGFLSRKNTSVVHSLYSGISKKHEWESECYELLNIIELQEYRDAEASSLDQEKQKRLSIGIALASRPELILLDEPTGGVNVNEIDRLVEITKRIKAMGTTVCLIEHKMRMVMSLCERLIVLDHGQKIAEGTPKEIQNNELAIQAYLGEEHAT
jgi:ABC-type branched-subunit amino acid transport system ATPase component